MIDLYVVGSAVEFMDTVVNNRNKKGTNMFSIFIVVYPHCVIIVIFQVKVEFLYALPLLTITLLFYSERSKTFHI